MERIFEPFFTTKGVGKGTGPRVGDGLRHRQTTSRLGGSRQPAGVKHHVQGVLPAVQSSVNQTEFVQNPDAIRGGAETILVVEDEPALRELVTKVLRNHGYQVLKPPTARRRSASGRGVPKTSAVAHGYDDAGGDDRVGTRGTDPQETPDLKVLFTSGYSPEILGRSPT